MLNEIQSIAALPIQRSSAQSTRTYSAHNNGVPMKVGPPRRRPPGIRASEIKSTVTVTIQRASTSTAAVVGSRRKVSDRFIRDSEEEAGDDDNEEEEGAGVRRMKARGEPFDLGYLKEKKQAEKNRISKEGEGDGDATAIANGEKEKEREEQNVSRKGKERQVEENHESRQEDADGSQSPQAGKAHDEGEGTDKQQDVDMEQEPSTQEHNQGKEAINGGQDGGETDKPREDVEMGGPADDSDQEKEASNDKEGQKTVEESTSQKTIPPASPTINTPSATQKSVQTPGRGNGDSVSEGSESPKTNGQSSSKDPDWLTEPRTPHVKPPKTYGARRRSVG